MLDSLHDLILRLNHGVNMRAKKEENMEYKILKAAEKLFLEQGFIRTKMAQIAEEAGCNQALVHYYYRTKELLFEKIYEEKIEQMLSNLLITTSSDAPFEENILNLISVHFEFLKQNPQLPAFSLNEGLNNSSENMTFLIQKFKKALQTVIIPMEAELKKEIEKGTIRPISTIDLLFTVLSLNIAPFLIAPIFRNVWELSEEEFHALLDQRKEEVSRTILARLKN